MRALHVKHGTSGIGGSKGRGHTSLPYITSALWTTATFQGSRVDSTSDRSSSVSDVTSNALNTFVTGRVEFIKFGVLCLYCLFRKLATSHMPIMSMLWFTDKKGRT